MKEGRMHERMNGRMDGWKDGFLLVSIRTSWLPKARAFNLNVSLSPRFSLVLTYNYTAQLHGPQK